MDITNKFLDLVNKLQVKESRQESCLPNISREMRNLIELKKEINNLFELSNKINNQVYLSQKENDDLIEEFYELKKHCIDQIKVLQPQICSQTKSQQWSEYLENILLDINRSLTIELPEVKQDTDFEMEYYEPKTEKQSEKCSTYAIDKVPKEYVAYLQKLSAQLANESTTNESDEAQTPPTKSLEERIPTNDNSSFSERPKSSPIEKRTLEQEGPSSSPPQCASALNEEEHENVSEELLDIGRESVAMTLKFKQNENKLLSVQHQLASIRATRRKMAEFIASQSEMVDSMYESAEQAQTNLKKGNKIIHEETQRKGLTFEEKISVVIFCLGVLLLFFHVIRP